MKGDIFDVRYVNLRLLKIIQMCLCGVDRQIGDSSLWGEGLTSITLEPPLATRMVAQCVDVYPLSVMISQLFAGSPGKYIVYFKAKFSCVPPPYVFVSCHSFGGIGMYGEGCPYHLFSGRDASRALAKMSFDAEYLDNPCTDDLTGKYLNV